MELHPTQKLVAVSNSPYRVVCCGRQWGKTTLAVLEMIAYAFAEDDREVAYFATTFDQARNIAWEMLKKMSKAAWAKPPNESRLELMLKTSKGGVSRITLRGWENVETARGQQFDFLVLDEVAQMRNFTYNWEAVLGPTLVFRRGKALFISTPYGYNHFFDLYMRGQRKEQDFESWKFTSYDNPHLPPVELQKKRESVTENYFQQEYLAEFKTFVGAVYKEFAREFHVKELNLSKFEPIYYLMGLDRGFRNPSAVPIIAVNKDDVWYQFDEIYEAGLTNPEIAEVIKQKKEGKNFEYSTADSANASDIKDLADLGVDFIPVKKESGEANKSYVRWKIEKFSDRLKVDKRGKTAYYVSPKCKYTIFEFEHYSYPETKDEKKDDEMPMKKDDHMMDALADLNAMYMHDYKPERVDPLAGKVPGTYITVSKPDYKDPYEQENFFEDDPDSYWDNPFYGRK